MPAIHTVHGTVLLNLLPWTLEEELHDLHLALATGSVKCRGAVALGVIQRLKVFKADAQLMHIKVNINKNVCICLEHFL